MDESQLPTTWLFPVVLLFGLLGLVGVGYSFVRSRRTDDPEATVVYGLCSVGSLLLFFIAGAASLVTGQLPGHEVNVGGIAFILLVASGLNLLFFFPAPWPYGWRKPRGFWRPPVTIAVLAAGIMWALTANVLYTNPVVTIAVALIFGLPAAYVGAGTTATTWRAFMHDEQWVKEQRRLNAPQRPKPSVPKPKPEPKPPSAEALLKKRYAARLREQQAVADLVTELEGKKLDDPNNAPLYEDMIADLQSGDWRERWRE